MLCSIRRTPNQLHSLQQIPTQHDMLPQHLVYKKELNHEYVMPLARNDETPWWWPEKIETCRSGFKCFKWKLHRCICWLIVEVRRLQICKPVMKISQWYSSDSAVVMLRYAWQIGSKPTAQGARCIAVLACTWFTLEEGGYRLADGGDARDKNRPAVRLAEQS